MCRRFYALSVVKSSKCLGFNCFYSGLSRCLRALPVTDGMFRNGMFLYNFQFFRVGTQPGNAWATALEIWEAGIWKGVVANFEMPRFVALKSTFGRIWLSGVCLGTDDWLHDTNCNIKELCRDANNDPASTHSLDGHGHRLTLQSILHEMAPVFLRLS